MSSYLTEKRTMQFQSVLFAVVEFADYPLICLEMRLSFSRRSMRALYFS